MNTIEIVDKILDINEKFNRVSDGSEDEVYYEVLHMSLSAIIRTLSREEYIAIPNPYRDTVDKLRKNIGRYTSQEYLDNIFAYEHKYGLFRDNIEETKKSNVKIGFSVNDENGIDI